MPDTKTERLLQEKLPALPGVVCQRSLKHDMDELAAAVLPPGRLAVIDDAHTAQALGDRAFRALAGRFACTHITLDAPPAATMEAVEAIRRDAAGCDALAAVGSGTVSDLCKYASFLDGKPYLVFPTAASMNGYLSANASISVDGYKKTLAAHMPKAVFCDLSVIAAAPARLNKSGLGDSLARPTAQADWLLSHILLGTPYDETPFTLLAPLEPQLLEQARGIATGDLPSLELLMQTLLLSGLGMTIAGGSYPASQGEHMIAHAYEMLDHAAPETFHGEQIGVTALVMANRQEKLLRHHPRLTLPPFPKEKMQALFGPKVAAEAEKAYAVKYEKMRQADPGARRRELWEMARERLAPVMLSPQKIRAVLEAADAPQKPETLGWSPVLFSQAAKHARFLRDRFTFLDLTQDY